MHSPSCQGLVGVVAEFGAGVIHEVHAVSKNLYVR